MTDKEVTAAESRSIMSLVLIIGFIIGGGILSTLFIIAVKHPNLFN
jgi:hypothetical protein